MAKIKKYQLGGLLKGIVKSGVKKAEKTAVKKITDEEMRIAFRSMERDRMKAMFKKIDAEDAAKAAAKKAVPKKKLGGKIKKAQKGDSLTYSTTGRYAPKQRVAIDTAGYASGKKEFTATSELSKKPRKVGRKIVDRTIGAMKAGKIKKAQFGSTEGGRCGVSRAAAKDARKSERDYAKQTRQAAREEKREVKAATKQAKRTPSMKKGGKISKKK